MKKIFLLFCLLSLETIAQNENKLQLLVGGNAGFQIGQTLRFSEDKGYSYQLHPFVGCSFWKGIAAGIEFSNSKTHTSGKDTEYDENDLGVGPFLRYYLRLNDHHSFYASFSYLTGKTDQISHGLILDASNNPIGTTSSEGNGKYRQLSPGLAYSYFFNQYVTLELGYFYNIRKEEQELSLHDVYTGGGSGGATFNFKADRNFSEFRAGFVIFLPLTKE